MISSLASLFVAKANATPENVVPCRREWWSAKLSAPDLRRKRQRPRGRENTHKIDTDDELSLTLASTFDLSSRVPLELLRDRATDGRGVASLASKARRRGATHGRTLGMVHAGRVAHRGAGVDRGRAASHLGRRCPVQALREGTVAAEGRGGALLIVARVAWGTVTRALVVHGKTGGRGGGTEGWCLADHRQLRLRRRRPLAGGGRRIRRLLELNLVGRLLVGEIGSAFTKAKAFEARVDRAHRGGRGGGGRGGGGCVVLKEEAAALGSGQEGQMGEKVRKVRFGCAASQSRDANAMQLRAMLGRASGGLFFRSVLGFLARGCSGAWRRLAPVLRVQVRN